MSSAATPAPLDALPEFARSGDYADYLGPSRFVDVEPQTWRLAVDATVGIADADCIVRLGRIARSRPDLAEAAIDALKDIDDPRTAAIVAAIPGLCQQSA